MIVQGDPWEESLSFSAWNTLPDHAPVGYMGRVSRPVYAASAALRNTINNSPPVLPFKPQQLSVCIVGSGGSGMSAALALSKFGHRVTIVERAAHVGGHATSVELN